MKAPPGADVAPMNTPPTPPEQLGPVEEGGFNAAVRAQVKANTWASAREGGDALASILATFTARRSGALRAVATPWPDVNAAMGGGFWPGLHVLVGATGAGKSQWALQLSLHAAGAGSPVVYIACELDALGITARAAAVLGRARARAHEGPHPPTPPPPWSAYFYGRETIPDTIAAELRALPFHWLEPPPHGFPYDAIPAAVEALRDASPNATGTPVVVIDFLQLLASPPGAREDTRERIGRAAYQCRAVARDLGAVVLALSSTARPTNNTPNPLMMRRNNDALQPPYLHDLVGLGKESGDVEYSADSVIALAREKGKRDAIYLGVAKLRAGRPSWCALRFDGTEFHHADLPPELLPDDAPPPSTGPTTLPARPSRGTKRRRVTADTIDNPNTRTEPDDGDDDA